MHRAWLLGCWGFVGASVALACGGSDDSGLFGSSGEATSSSSGAALSSSSGATASGSSGTTSSSGTTTSSSGASSGTLDAGRTDSGTDAAVKTCRPNVLADCADGEYCKVTNCAAAGGTCTKKPAVVPDTGPLICGCDGVTYWNEALAATFGVSVKQGGVCVGNAAKTCSNVVDCPNNRFCNYQTTASANICALSTQGTCWGVPKDCPVVANGKARPCGANINNCKSYCEAVKSEQPWYEDANCN